MALSDKQKFLIQVIKAFDPEMWERRNKGAKLAKGEPLLAPEARIKEADGHMAFSPNSSIGDIGMLNYEDRSGGFHGGEINFVFTNPSDAQKFLDGLIDFGIDCRAYAPQVKAGIGQGNIIDEYKIKLNKEQVEQLRRGINANLNEVRGVKALEHDGVAKGPVECREYFRYHLCKPRGEQKNIPDATPGDSEKLKRINKEKQLKKHLDSMAREDARDWFPEFIHGLKFDAGNKAQYTLESGNKADVEITADGGVVIKLEHPNSDDELFMRRAFMGWIGRYTSNGTDKFSISAAELAKLKQNAEEGAKNTPNKEYKAQCEKILDAQLLAGLASASKSKPSGSPSKGKSNLEKNDNLVSSAAHAVSRNRSDDLAGLRAVREKLRSAGAGNLPKAELYEGDEGLTPIKSNKSKYSQNSSSLVTSAAKGYKAKRPYNPLDVGPMAMTYDEFQQKKEKRSKEEDDLLEPTTKASEGLLDEVINLNLCGLAHDSEPQWEYLDWEDNPQKDDPDVESHYEFTFPGEEDKADEKIEVYKDRVHATPGAYEKLADVAKKIVALNSQIPSLHSSSGSAKDLAQAGEKLLEKGVPFKISADSNVTMEEVLDEMSEEGLKNFIQHAEGKEGFEDSVAYAESELRAKNSSTPGIPSPGGLPTLGL